MRRNFIFAKIRIFLDGSKPKSASPEIKREASQRDGR
jgi:hypothetical protein